jgi:hypothetical protein
MMTATSALEFLVSAMIDFHHFPRTALLQKAFSNEGTRRRHRADRVYGSGKIFRRPDIGAPDRSLALRYGRDGRGAIRLTVSEIFENQGEEAFREAETEALQELAGKRGAIITTGAGSC